jgi:hypothetical protein
MLKIKIQSELARLWLYNLPMVD